MNSADPLSALKDIVPAGEITWWPLAPGWWVLIVLSVAIIVGAALWFRRKCQSLMWKREALQEFDRLQKRYFEYTPNIGQQESNTSEPTKNSEALKAASLLNSELSVLLKRVLSSQRTGNDVRALATNAWAETLVKQIPVLSESEIRVIAFGHYQNDVPRLTNETFTVLRLWLKGLS